jgi:hypothetical protein
VSISTEDLNLAISLRADGCSWENIGIGLGINQQKLQRAVARLTEEAECECLNTSLAGGLRC